MITFYQKQCLEVPIKKGHAQALIKTICSLSKKYNAVINSSAEKFSISKNATPPRTNQLELWLKARSRSNFFLELFFPKNKEKFCAVIELKDIVSLGTSFGKKHKRTCKAYMLVYVFSEQPDMKKNINMFYNELKKAIKAQFNLKRIPKLVSVAITNKSFDDLKKKSKYNENSNKEELLILELLKNRDFRETILRIKTTKDATISNIAKSRAVTPMNIRPILDKASKNRIIKKEYNVICRDCKTILAKVPSKNTIIKMSNEKVSCSKCNKTIKRDSFEETFLVSSKIEKLLNGSRWLCIYIREKLDSFGLTSKRTAIEVVDGPNELDLIANADGEFIFMELKDKRFSIGNAYSFIGKCTQYKPALSVIISTDGIAPEVKEYIKNIGIKVHFVENIDEIESSFKSIFSTLYSKGLLQLMGQMNWNAFVSKMLLGTFALDKNIEEDSSELEWGSVSRRPF